MIRKLALSVLLCLTSCNLLPRFTVGSDTAVSVEPFRLFPANSDNSILSFAFLKNGFALQDATTSCSFASLYPVSGDVSLNGGTLSLGTDLYFRNPTQLLSSGLLLGNEHQIELSQSVTWLPSSGFYDAQLFLNNDLTVAGTIQIHGNCLIDGCGNNLSLDPSARIIIAPNSTLKLRNAECYGLRTGKLLCVDDSGQLILDNINWVQEAEYSFTNGSILFVNENNFIGPHTFIYDSTMTSTISFDSTWYLSDALALRIGRKNGIWSREPLVFADRSSVLKLEGCTVTITPSGAQFLKGTVLVDREVILDSESTSSTNGLLLGDGTSEGDLVWQLYPGACMSMIDGYFVYDIANINNFVSGGVAAKVIRSGTSVLYIKQNIDFSNIDIHIEDSSAAAIVPGKVYWYQDAHLVTSMFDLYLTGMRDNTWNMYLNGSGSINMISGSMPFPVIVCGPGNSFLGSGNLAGPIFLTTPDTTMSFRFNGFLNSTVYLNNGTMILENNVQMGHGGGIVGPGVVDLGAHALALQSSDISLTNTVLLRGSLSTISLNNNWQLDTELVFDGDCTIEGNNNELSLGDAARIVVNKNSTVHFKNIILNGLSGTNIQCQDGTGTIVFKNVTLILSDDFTWNSGCLKAYDSLNIAGGYIFALHSIVTTEIASHATVQFDAGTTLRYAPLDGLNNHIVFDDWSSTLVLNSTKLYSTAQGLQLKAGRVVINGNCSLYVEDTVDPDTGAISNAGIIIGNNSDVDDNEMSFNEGALLDVQKGCLVYRNVLNVSWLMAGVTNVLRLEPYTILQLDQPLDIGKGCLQLSSLADLCYAPGIQLKGSVDCF